LDDIVQEFLVESNENLDRLESELVKLEANPKSSELLASIFRSIHSTKGACGFLGFNKLQALAHAGESLLSKLRDGLLVLTPEISSALLATSDAIRQILAAISTTGQDGEEAYNDLIETLKRLLDADAAGSAAEPGRALAASAGAGNRGETISPAPAAELPPPAASSATPPPRARKKKSPPREKIQNASPEPLLQTAPSLPPLQWKHKSPRARPRRPWSTPTSLRTHRTR
jgi:two-component system chemotaxis sensor kinase CheA